MNKHILKHYSTVSHRINMHSTGIAKCVNDFTVVLGDCTLEKIVILPVHLTGSSFDPI